MAIFSSGLLPVSGLNINWLSNTRLTVSPGQAVDVFEEYNINITAPLTLDNTVSGVNGLDTGAIAASTLYFVYLIANNTNIAAPATLLSLSDVFPVLPTSYNTYRRIGLWYTDGSSHYSLLTQDISVDNFRQYNWTTPVSVLSAGTATSFTVIDSSAAVPGLDPRGIIVNTTYTPFLAGNVYYLSGISVSTNVPPDGIGAAPTVPQTDAVSLYTPNSATVSSSFYYKVTASDTLSISVVSFTDTI